MKLFTNKINETRLKIILFASASLFLVLFFLLSVFSGNALSVQNAKTIILNIRLPRTLACVFCGSFLSCAGLVLQVSLNNALASPGIIGVNAGSGLFVLLSLLLFPYSFTFASFFALLGAVVSVLFVYLISERCGLSKTTLVLAGVAVSSLMSAGIDVLITLHPEIIADKVAFNLGGFQNVSFAKIRLSVPIGVLSLIGIFFLSSGIDLFSLGDECAYSLGLNVKHYRLLSIILSGVLAGCAVSMCGLLGFVGLIIPNFVRLFSFSKIRTKLFLCILFGADFLLLCDMLSRFLFFPYEVPVGLFLSCLGSPFFIWMLIRKKRKLSV